MRKSPSSASPVPFFEEMSVLLTRPHTATVRATSPVGVFVLEHAESFLKSHPEIAFFLGKLLAERLNAATTYLVDLKRQLEGQGNHFGMVGFCDPPSHLATFSPASLRESRSWLPEQIRIRVLARKRLKYFRTTTLCARPSTSEPMSR